MTRDVPKPRTVLDTNVLLSALGFGGPATERLWELAEEGEFDAFVSPWILEEFRRNLVVKADFLPKEAIEMVKYVADIVEPKRGVSVIRAKDSDNRILECALEAKADVIVTGDLKHIRSLNFFEGIEILTPREFMDKYFPRG